MKGQVNARVSEATRAKLDALTAIYGTQAEVLAVAIDRLYQSADVRQAIEAAKENTMDTIDSLVAEYKSATSEKDRKTAYAKAYRILSDEGSLVAYAKNPQEAREQAREQCRSDVAEYRRRIEAAGESAKEG